jgi:imidazolonepropionase-like amidohydrolase
MATVRTVLRGGTLIDGTGSKPVARSVVVMEGDRITKVGKAGDFGADLARLGEVLDVTGKTVLPGLINGHEHLVNRWGAGTFQERAAQDTHYIILRAARNCLTSLQEGVTTVRDCSGRYPTNLVVRQAVNEGMLIGPRVFTTGQAIAMTGGHADENAFVADGVDAVRKAARTLLRRGVDIIKCMASGGYVTQGRDAPWTSQLSAEEMRVAFEEAHRAGRPTTVHAHPPQAIRFAMEAEVDCIEHAGLLDAATAELMAAKGIYLVPTLGESWVMAERGLELGRPKWLVEASKGHLDKRMDHFRHAVRAGIKCGAGTDVIGDLATEMTLMMQGGMTAMGVIESATRINAEILQRADEFGTVTAGKLADVIVIDGDPLADMNAIRKVSLVFKGGRLFRPEVLAGGTGKTPL